ncbi:MAG TPA: 2Fe-2S iron-sulfur cluster-binding protein [Polyangiaceae bacterium]|nr:2Fe-2S iron-sulfur cluster-binding protein [Polyangiaceae bacterium]
MTAPCSPLAQALQAFGVAGSRDRPLVIAFAPCLTLRQSPVLENVRAELRALGAALLLVGEAVTFSFQPDDELDIAGRGEPCDANTRAELRRARGLRCPPVASDELTLIVANGEGLIIARQVVAASDGLAALALGLRAAGQELRAARRTTTLSRRELVLLSLVGAFALLAAQGCRDTEKTVTSHAAPLRQSAASRPITLHINGQTHLLELEPRVSLLDALRERLGLTGTKKGCDHGQCGACTVLVDGRRVNACLTLAVMVGPAPITTIEGLSEDDTFGQRVIVRALSAAGGIA